MKTFLLIAGFLFAGSAFANGDGLTADQLVDAAKLVLNDFKTDRPDLADDVTAFKAWKSGDEGKVRIYVTNDRGQSLSFVYGCHSHDDLFECHAQ